MFLNFIQKDVDLQMAIEYWDLNNMSAGEKFFCSLVF